MTTKVDILGDLSIHGSLIFLKDEASFPADASVGTLVLKGSNLYAYIQVGDFTTWYPFNSKTRSYIHTQAIPNTTWTVNHNLGSSDVWYQVYMSTGAPIFASRTIVDSNTFTIDLTEAITGTVVVVAPDTVDVPTVKAQSLTVTDGTGVTTTIDSSGIRVNGTFVATTANISTYVTNAVDTAIGNLADVASSGDYDDLINTPSLATVATSGSYADLSNKPSLATVATSGAYSDLTGKPSLATVATSGSYNDLLDLPQSFSASFSDLTNVPTTLSGYGITDAVTSDSPTFTGTITQNGVVVSEITAVSALDVNCSTGNYFTKTISADTTFTFSNAPNGVAYSFTLRVDQSSGTYTTGITWPASVTWPGNSAPSLTAGKTHLFVFVTENGGTKWRGAALTNYVT